MTRQSISFTEKNNKWLNAQINDKEYASKSELINALVRQARGQEAQVNWIKTKLVKAEQSGFTQETEEEILLQSKKLLNEKL